MPAGPEPAQLPGGLRHRGARHLGAVPRASHAPPAAPASTSGYAPRPPATGGGQGRCATPGLQGVHTLRRNVQRSRGVARRRLRDGRCAAAPPRFGRVGEASRGGGGTPVPPDPRAARPAAAAGHLCLTVIASQLAQVLRTRLDPAAPQPGRPAACAPGHASRTRPAGYLCRAGRRPASRGRSQDPQLCSRPPGRGGERRVARLGGGRSEPKGGRNSCAGACAGLAPPEAESGGASAPAARNGGCSAELACFRGAACEREPCVTGGASNYAGHCLAEFAYRCHLRYYLADLVPQLAEVAARTPPVPRLSNLAGIAGEAGSGLCVKRESSALEKSQG